VSRRLLIAFAPLLIAAAFTASLQTIAPHGALASEAADGQGQRGAVFQTGEHWQGTDADDSDEDPLIGRFALYTIAASAIAALIALIGYFIRRGVGYDPHRPGPEDEPSHH
jgi:hypothetical protein